MTIEGEWWTNEESKKVQAENDSRFGSLYTQYSSLRDRAARAAERLEKLEETVRYLDDSIEQNHADLSAEIDALRERIYKIEQSSEPGPPPPIIELPPEPPQTNERVTLKADDLTYLGYYTIAPVETDWYNSGPGIAIDAHKQDLCVAGNGRHGRVGWFWIDGLEPAIAGTPLPSRRAEVDPTAGERSQMELEDGTRDGDIRLGGLFFDVEKGALVALYHNSFGAAQPTRMIAVLDGVNARRIGAIEESGRVVQQRTGGYMCRAPDWWTDNHTRWPLLVGCVTESIRGQSFEGPAAYEMSETIPSDGWCNATLLQSFPGSTPDGSGMFTNNGNRIPTKADMWSGMAFVDTGTKAGIVFSATLGHRGAAQSTEDQYYHSGGGPNSHPSWPTFQGYHAPPYVPSLVCFDPYEYATVDSSKLAWRWQLDLRDKFLETDHDKPYANRCGLAWDGVRNRLYVKECWPGKPEPVIHVWEVR